MRSHVPDGAPADGPVDSALVDSLLADLDSIGLSGPGREIPLFSDEPKLASWFYPTPSAGPYRNEGPYGLALSSSPAVARLKALAEFYERLCLHNAAAEQAARPWREGADHDPASFAPAFLRADAAMVERLRSASYRWKPAVRLATCAPTSVPAQVVLTSYDRGDEPAIQPKVGSSGAALGRRGDGGAWRRGLFEVVERHIASSFQIDAPGGERIVELPPRATATESVLRRYRLEPYVFPLRNAFDVPCIAVALTDHSGVGPALSRAMRAAPTWAAAIEEGLLEALERRRPARLERLRGEPENPVYPWPTLDRMRRALPGMESARPIPYRALEAPELAPETLLERLETRGLEVLSVDLTVPEVAAAGLEVLKVLIPGFGPLPA